MTTTRRVATHVVFLCVLVWACTVAIRGSVQKAEEVLEQVTAALGGAAKLRELTALSAEGSFRRVTGDQEMSGELELSFLFPDRFQRIERPEGPPGMSRLALGMTLDGEEGWRGPIGGGGGGMFVMRGPGGGPPAPESITRNVREEYWRTLVGLLPTASALGSLQFAHAGTAESPDGIADVLDVTGPEGFVTRLFLDSRTHLPLMLTYKGLDPRAIMRTVRMGGRGQRPASREEAEQRREEMRKRLEAEGPPGQVEVTWYFADHQPEAGIQLPRRMSRAIDGQVFEEWQISKYKCNPNLKVDQFKKPS